MAIIRFQNVGDLFFIKSDCLKQILIIGDVYRAAAYCKAWRIHCFGSVYF
jgi:hypothetical protein